MLGNFFIFFLVILGVFGSFGFFGTLAVTDVVSDPIVVLNKIYATSVLSKYSSTKYQNCYQIKNLLQIKLRIRAIYDVAFPKINSILCHIDTALLGKKFYIGQVNTPPNGRHIIFATYQQLVILRDNTSWFVDATFRIVKLPFMQFYLCIWLLCYL